MIDLDNNTVTLKESANQQEQACSASVPLTGTFIPQGKKMDKTFTSEGSVQPPAVTIDISAYRCAPVRNISHRRKW